MSTQKQILTSFIIYFIMWILIALVAYNKDKQIRKSKDYQLDATPKGYTLYSGSEEIGFIPAGNSTLDSLIISHNQ